MTTKFTCFCDMDGVITDFVGGVERRFNTSVDFTNNRGNDDIPAILGIDKSDFYSKVADAEFWAELEWQEA